MSEARSLEKSLRSSSALAVGRARAQMRVWAALGHGWLHYRRATL